MVWSAFSGGTIGALEAQKAELEANIRKGKKKREEEEEKKGLKQEPAQEVKETVLDSGRKEEGVSSVEKK